MSDERRMEYRKRFCIEGFSVFGGALNEVKIRDVTAKGVGLLSVNALKKDEQGVLFARLPNSCEMDQFPIKVCWCIANAEAAKDPYLFRVGLKILKNSGDSELAGQEAPAISLAGPEAQNYDPPIPEGRRDIFSRNADLQGSRGLSGRPRRSRKKCDE